MTDLQAQQRASYPGNTWADIARRDGPLPPVLAAQANPPQDMRDIAYDRYTSPAFFDLEIERMWKRVWQFATRAEYLAEEGDYVVYDLARLSVVLVRSAGAIKGYVNSCLHRGTKLKPSGDAGWARALRCPYHGWEWGLDGALGHIPCAAEFAHLDRAGACLPQVRVETWNGNVFINFAADGPDLATYLEALPDHFAHWDMTGWYVHAHIRKTVPGNWKLAQEAFMEAYHTPVVHPEMTHVVGDHNMQHDIFSAHISRDLCAMASPSPTIAAPADQLALLDKMLVGDGTMIGTRAQVPEGKTARWVMAEQLKASMLRDYGLDYTGHSVPEMIDSLKYAVFPNANFYPAPGLCLIQTFRPAGHDHDRAWFDQLVLRPKPTDGDFTPARVTEIDEDTAFASVPGIDPFLASVLDQDTDIMRWQREGMYASAKGAQTLSNYQESRIRHLHDTLDSYLFGDK